MKNKVKDLATATILSALYISLGFALQNIAFGAIQIRVADALYPLIGILGFPALAGCFLGHLLFNIYGYSVGLALGIGDLASPFIFLIPKWLIYKYGKTTISLLITTAIHVIFVATWVSWLLYSLYNIPFWLSVFTVGLGETIAEIIIGVPLAIAIKKRLSK